MRQRILAAVIGFFLATFAQAAPKPGTVEFFQDLTERRSTAYLERDRAFYEKLLSADFVLFGDGGKTTGKKDYLDAEFAAAHSKNMKPFFSISDFRLIARRDSFAIVGYLKTEGMKIGEQTYAAEARRMDTYAFEDGQWRLIAMAAALVVKPPATSPLAADVLAEYAGKYSLADGLVSKITVAGDHLADQTTGHPETALWSVGPDEFFDPADAPTARTTFTRNRDGKVVSWTYTNANQKIIARRID
jgi:hypothetical protein